MSLIRTWNDMSLRLVADDHTGAPAPLNQGGPTHTSYALAMIHLAMHDAVAGIDGTFSDYATTPATPPAGGDADQALCAAAHSMALHLYPSHATMIDVTFQTARNALGLGTGPQTPSEKYGVKCTDALVLQRTGDGSQATKPYVFSNDPGAHRPDPSFPGQGVLGAEWGDVTPFTYTSAHPSLPPPPSLQSQKYLDAYNEVYLEGRADLPQRKPQQAMKGIYWGYDGAQKLGTPPRLYNQIARAICDPRNLSLKDEARFYALINVGMADAGIACWHHKYVFNFWRPVVGIREAAFGAGPSERGDTFKKTDGDPFWLPLGAPDTNGTRVHNLTPGFPAYPSGHSTFGATCFQLIAHFLNSTPKAEKFAFVSDEFNGTNRDSTNVVRPHLKRWFNLAEAITENALSRVYLGVHWIFDAKQGIALADDLVPRIYTKMGSPKAPKAKSTAAPADIAPSAKPTPAQRNPAR